MDILEAIKKRQTIRAYKRLPVDDKILNTILDAGRLAPSWANSQTWRFIVVKDKNIMAELLENAVAPGNRATNAFKQAPVVIAACAELNNAGFRDGKPLTDKGGYWYMFDAGVAMENMVLTATSLGLGTVFVGRMDSKKAEGILEVPSGFTCVILMVLGYPDEQPVQRPRKELSEIVFQNKFGVS
jgi:nitroreductase